VNLIVVQNSAIATVLHKGRVVKANMVPSLKQADDLLSSIDTIIAEAKQAASLQSSVAADVAGKIKWDEKLIQLEYEVNSDRKDLRDQVSKLAIEIVRHLAPAVGALEMVPALVDKLAKEQIGDLKLQIHVHPDVVAATRSRTLTLNADVEVFANPEADLFSCIIETPHGKIDGSLETQLFLLNEAFTADSAHE
jgi:flagellar biosynthesis/type III secretory pathway protein FliH